MTDKPKLLIIDAMSLAHRAYHAFSRGGEQLRTPDGEPTSATYGFATMLLNLLEDIEPDYAIVTTDSKEPTFRHEEFEDYKAHREEPDDEFLEQLPRIKELAEAFHIPYYIKPGFEADDIIASMTEKLNDEYEIYIASGDFDLFQILDTGAKIWAPKRGSDEPVIYDEDWLKKEKGLTSDQVIDYKALKGDSADNIPGVPGIGEVTATKLLDEYDDLETIYENLDEIGGKTAEKLKENKEQAMQSKMLVTLKRKLDVEFDPEKSHVDNFDREKVRKLFKELHFKSLLDKIPDGQRQLL